jgi:2-oxoglutarate dehydrogenase E2 component (dihydrolipoamide succinyltransferase)
MSNILVPQLGESVVEARVARWLKKEGDRVETGEPVVELETDKIDLEVGADHGGVISSIKHPEGDDVKVGELLAVVDEAGTVTPKPVPKAEAPAAPQSAETQRATPTAKRVADEHKVDLKQVTGSGTAGRVTKRDVQTAIAPTESAVAPAKEAKVAPAATTEIAPTPEKRIAPSDRREERVRMTKRRETIARRLVEAQHTAAMLTTFNEIDMSALMALRERRKETFKKQYGVSFGITSFFVKAVVAALRGFPQLNAEVDEDEIVLKHYYDIGIAVGAEGGLVVPVLKNADLMTFPQIELAIRDFADRAAKNTLTLDDLMGGTFTVTNGGVFGSLLSTPILNPPQVGILGLHKIEDRAVPVQGQVAIRPMMYVALSYDHRIVDGREAVQFLVKIKEFVEDPGSLLLAT